MTAKFEVLTPDVLERYFLCDPPIVHDAHDAPHPLRDFVDGVRRLNVGWRPTGYTRIQYEALVQRAKTMPDENGNTHFGPMCSCGSRNTVRATFNADPLLDTHGPASDRRCLDCGRVSSFRVSDGHYVPLAPETARELDDQRKHPIPPGVRGAGTRAPWAWPYPQGRPQPRLLHERPE